MELESSFYCLEYTYTARYDLERHVFMLLTHENNTFSFISSYNLGTTSSSEYTALSVRKSLKDSAVQHCCISRVSIPWFFLSPLLRDIWCINRRSSINGNARCSSSGSSASHISISEETSMNFNHARPITPSCQIFLKHCTNEMDWSAHDKSTDLPQLCYSLLMYNFLKMIVKLNHTLCKVYSTDITTWHHYMLIIFMPTLFLAAADLTQSCFLFWIN